MRKIFRFFRVPAICLVLAIGSHLYYLTTLSPKEKYPDDEYLARAENKNALIIVAHDDDMIGSSGTMSMLCSEGWVIREMCFYQKGGLYLKSDSLKNPVRKRSLNQAAMIQGPQGTDQVDFNLRKDMETERSYMPMPYELFSQNYKIGSMLKIIGDYISKYRPSVIFSLGDVMGGYGHPDRTMIGQLIVRYAVSIKMIRTFEFKGYIRRCFLPPWLTGHEAKCRVYNEAKKIYHANGMPVPAVQVNFYNYARQKKQCMQAFTTKQNLIRQILPYYNWYPHWIYFRIFDRDFFRVVDVTRL